ncbi:IrmA family protein [Silvania hatchlandensis]|uniref:IrmA family protein n=1 Tax=Silvania hatchlandensis TaxID=2926469 RepID=A0A9J6Q4E5_9ENTR|nr:IrmA family protein [Silvania hatchlandensis]MCU6665921.1 IrmA family protein [Silvania hatchlandensis]
MMKQPLKVVSMLAGLLFVAPASALEIWHSNTVWANQGMCSATFMLDSGMTEVGPLEIGVELVNAQGVVVAIDTLNVDAFGDSEATRYQTSYLEGEAVCEDDLTVRFTSLTLVSGQNKKTLPLHELQIRAFKPFMLINQQEGKQR